MTRRIWIPAVAALLACAIYAAFFRRSEEDRVRERLTQLSAAVRVEAGGTGASAARALRIQKEFEAIFSPKVRIQIADLDDLGGGRDGLTAFAVTAGASFRSLELGFDKVRVEITPGARSASVVTEATVATTALDGTSKDTRKLDIRFENVDGAWRIAAVIGLDGGA